MSVFNHPYVVKKSQAVNGNWEIDINQCSEPLKIKVERLPSGKYLAKANLDPYIPGKTVAASGGIGQPCDSAEKSVEKLLLGFLILWQPGVSKVQPVAGWKP